MHTMPPVFNAGDTIYFPFDAYDSNGASVTISGFAVTDIEIYKNGSTTQRASDNGYALLDTDGIDFDGTTGLHGFSVDTSDNSDAGFWADGAQYWVNINAITVDSQTVRFTYFLTLGYLLRPTTAGRKLDVSSGGEAGLDWANVGSPTTTLNLSGTTVKTLTDAPSDSSGVTTLLSRLSALRAGYLDNINNANLASVPAFPANFASLSIDASGRVDLGKWIGTAPLALSSQQVQAIVPDTQKVDVNTIKTQAVTAAAGVTFPTSIASPTNITSASGVSLVSAYDPAKTAAQAGDAMTLTAGERNSVADALLDRNDAIETGISLRLSQRYIAAACCGVITTSGQNPEVFKGIGVATTRLSVANDSSGNRTAVTLS